MLNLSFADNFVPGRHRAYLMLFLTSYGIEVAELMLMLNLSFADNFVPGRRRAILMPFLISYVENYYSLKLELMLMPNVSAADNFVPGRCRAILMPLKEPCREIHKTAGDLTDKKNLPLCLLYTSPSPRDKRQSRMPSSA